MAEDTKQTDYSFSEQFEPDVFWQVYGRKIVSGLVVVVAVGLIIFLWQQNKVRAAATAAERLATARDGAALEAVIRDYAGQPVAALARLQLAAFYFQTGRVPEAAQQYQTFLNDHPHHPLAPTAQLGLATAAEAGGDWLAARQQYERLAGTATENYTLVLAKLGLARCAEQSGQLKEAQQLYEELMALTQGTALQARLYLRRVVLGRELSSATTSTVSPSDQPAMAPAGTP